MVIPRPDLSRLTYRDPSTYIRNPDGCELLALRIRTRVLLGYQIFISGWHRGVCDCSAFH